MVRPLDHLQPLEWKAAEYTLFQYGQPQNIQYHVTGVVLKRGVKSCNIAQCDAAELQNQYSHPFSQTFSDTCMLKAQSEQRPGDHTHVGGGGFSLETEKNAYPPLFSVHTWQDAMQSTM